MVVKGATIPGAVSFKHHVLISPGPDDLPGSSDRISSSTVSCVTVFNRNVVLIVGDAGSSISVSVLGRTPAALFNTSATGSGSLISELPMHTDSTVEYV